MHYTRKRREGRPERVCEMEDCAETNVNRAGPSRCEKHRGSLKSTGYVLRWIDGVGKFAHRVTMSEMLGRDLFPGENVHHKKGVRSDNRPENLELWVSHQPKGQRPEDLLEWADEIITRYRGTSP